MRLAALVEHKIKKPDRVPFAWASRCPMLLGIDKDTPMPLLLATAKEAHERFMKEFSLPLGLIWIDRGGPGCLNRISASISGVSAEVRLPSGEAAT
jgi:hypothetical protein